MNRFNGKQISPYNHIRQSITDILMTPVGTRVKRREYGSHLFDLIDTPGNGLGLIHVIAAAADAIERWEPRVKLMRGRLEINSSGRSNLQLDLVTSDGVSLTSELEVP